LPAPLCETSAMLRIDSVVYSFMNEPFRRENELIELGNFI
jgi:hypothetical protein